MSGSERDYRRQHQELHRLPRPNVSSSPADRADQRAHPRYDIELEVGLSWAESNFYVGLTENISEGGLFISTHELRPIGTEVEVTIHLPNHPQPIRAIGTVRWHRMYCSTSDASPGMGVQFDSMSDEHLDAVREFLSKRAPLFYED